jgi:hypothetical protein
MLLNSFLIRDSRYANLIKNKYKLRKRKKEVEKNL